jgi:deoxyribodipyrimidine photolyase-related protein
MRSIWVLGDQLSPDNAALAEAEPGRDRVVLIGSRAWATRFPYHRKRLVLILSAMRHFAADLRGRGWEVDEIGPGAAPTLEAGWRAIFARGRPDEIVVASPNDWATAEALPKLARKLGVPIRVVETRQFLCGRDEFLRWAGGGKHLRMETFYRRMRQKTGYLMEEGKPVGGAWNFDAANRKGIRDWEKAGRPRPAPVAWVEPDAVTRETMEFVDREFAGHPGEASGFAWPVDRAGAERWLRAFVAERLDGFGPYEDLMVAGEPALFHSLLSPLLNLGLLGPAECCEAAIGAWRAGAASLESAEGFVRQIIGWREFVRGVYWLRMPGYAGLNGLGAEGPLPEFFWTGDTPMNCMRQVLSEVRASGFNHHIQRLMILSNYLLLAGVRPAEALDWFNAMYLDAHEWVMAANVVGMGLHADGGFMASKPYAATGAYVARMSDYCRGCEFRPDARSGERACPFHALYWAFWDRHADRFRNNPRVAFPLKHLDGLSAAERADLRARAERWLAEH